MMKITAILITAGIVQVHASAFSQEVSIHVKGASLQHVLGDIEKQTGYVVLSSRQIYEQASPVHIQIDKKPLSDALKMIMSKQPLTYKLNDKTIIIKLAENKKGEVLPLKESTVPQTKITVRGTVKDEQQQPLNAVEVRQVGTNTVAFTDEEGRYMIAVESGSQLRFHLMGYQDFLMTATNENGDVTLAEAMNNLDELVVVGYGLQRKKDLTGAITTVSPEVMKVVTTADPVQALQGRVSGLMLMSNTQPGQNSSIRVRGVGSINASSSPLIVLDGFPLVNSDLSSINASEIESMEVLKDASATAIYGSRGANGVIIITTKKGASGQDILSYSANLGVQSPARLVELINRDEFVDFINAAYTNQTGRPVYTEENPAPQVDTDWERQLIKSQALLQEHTLSLSGGTDNTKYFFSGNFYDQKGLVYNSKFTRYSLRANVEHTFKDWLKAGVNMQLTKRFRNDPSEPRLDNIFRWGWPTLPVYNEDGSYYYAADDPLHSSYFDIPWNPVSDRYERSVSNPATRNLADLFVEVKLTPHLKWRSNVAADISNSQNRTYASSQHFTGRASNGNGSQSYSELQTVITENMLTYTGSWDDHRLTATGVYSYQYTHGTNIGVTAMGFPTDNTGIDNLGLAEIFQNLTSDRYSSKLASWTGRVSYAFKDRYLLTATGRFDGSSRFGENNKWGFFPSFGLGWVASDEAFIKQITPISLLKIRMSLGTTGNQEIGNYASLASMNRTFYSINDQSVLGYMETIGNKDLKWEQTTQLDIGMDLNLFQDRVNLVFDYYKRNTRNLLYSVPIPTSSGFGNMLQNIGEIENKGIEFTANVALLRNAFRWNIGGNITHNKNQFVELYNGLTELWSGGRKLGKGLPVDGQWAFQSGGIIYNDEQLALAKLSQPNAEIGAEMFIDQNGDNLLNQYDNVLIGTSVPNFYYGVNTSFGWKNWGLEVYGQGATNMVLADSYLLYGEYQLQNRSYIPTKYAYDRMWREDNPTGTFPKPGARNSGYSDNSRGHKEFFVIKNIRLNYTINEMKRWKWLSQATLYLNFQNYFNFANFRGYNPENGTNNYPLAKIAMLGINANF